MPTSYYAAVQFVCRPTVVDDSQGKAEILTAQLADFQPEGGHAAVAPGAAPYGRMLPGIRGVRLTVLRVDAKFKYDDANPVEHRQRVIGRLERRGHGLDAGAATQQRRRLAAIGDRKTLFAGFLVPYQATFARLTMRRRRGSAVWRFRQAM